MLNLTGYIQTDRVYIGTRTIVYRATGTLDQQPVIIKVLRNSHPNFNELVQFRNQYTITKHLSHPGIIQPLALERYGNGYALIMPDEGAIALTDYWKKSYREIGEFLRIAIELAEVLHYLNQQRIIHKDIKPANILICPQTHQIKLIDFSISSLLPKEQQQLINPNVLEGTLAYISPEQTGRMNRGIDYRTDFYSLGVTFYEILTGILPFDISEPIELVHCHIAQTPLSPHLFPDAMGNNYPETLSEIILKLMAKNAEDRYQSALGLKHDLEQCLQQLETTGEITEFEIGQRDICDRFNIPEKLYGREPEVAQLLAAFERVASSPASLSSQSALMLVAGFSGIGKTAVVNEVHKPIVRQRGYFIKGKFDQFNRNIPFSAFVQALRDLMGQLLSESDAELGNWKRKILSALGDNGQVIIEVIPELERIIGKQPAVPELSGSAAQNRFNLLFGNFIQIFTTKEHPLVIFLDDLQWADSASLNLLTLLMSQSETGYLLLLGAYRDNEVFPAHPLMLTLKELEQNQALISTIVLLPLALADINQLVAQTLSCSETLAQPLTELIYQKTQGNPFFTTQFLQGLHQEGLITFNFDLGYWECDLTRVRDAALSDDVVEFMADRLHKLPDETQELLKLAACIGNQFDLETLAIVSQQSAEDVAVNLWGALQEVLLLPINKSYKFFQGLIANEPETTAPSVSYRFLHDRVQQAAYSLIPEVDRKITHLKIGQLLLKKVSTEALELKIFDIVSQLNQGIDLLSDPSEKRELATLNLQAGKKAKAATAYQAGIKHFAIGIKLLPKNSWETDYELTFELHKQKAEVEYFIGDFNQSKASFYFALNAANNKCDQAEIYTLLMTLQMSQGENIHASVDAGIKGLNLLGINLPIASADLQELANYQLEELQAKLENVEPADLLKIPDMTDPIQKACMKLLAVLWSAAYLSGNQNLSYLTSLLMLNISLDYGSTETSSVAYGLHGITLSSQGDYQTAYKFGELSLQLDRHFNSLELIPKNNNHFAHAINPYVRHLKTNLPIYQESFRVCNDTGNMLYAVWAVVFIIWTMLIKGDLLSDIYVETEKYANYVKQVNDINMLQTFKLQQEFILNLQNSQSTELLEPNHSHLVSSVESFQTNNFEIGISWYYLLKLQLLYFHGRYSEALEIVPELEARLKANLGFFPVVQYYFYYPLSLSALYAEKKEQSKDNSLKELKEHQEKLKKFADHCPDNFAHRYWLLSAEIAKIYDRYLEAIDHYDRAIALAKQNGYIHEEALANELAAKFYLDWGKERIASAYMTDAYYCYARWGSQVKTDQLETEYPQLLMAIKQPYADFNAIKSLKNLTQTISATIQNQSSTTSISDTLDFTSLLKAAQSLTSTIELDPLLADISQIILTNSGATKAVLLIPQDDQWQLRAIAQLTNDGRIETNTRSQPLTPESLVPIRVIHYVKNTLKPLVINEEHTEISGIIEGYLLQYQPQSVFCLPLLDRRKLVAMLYLEHPKTKGVFTRNRQTVVEFLCTQAAISLQNAQLYEKSQQSLHDLQQTHQDLKQAQLQLVQSEKMSALGNLMTGVAHEINNPTGFLKGNIQPAQEYLKDLLALIDLYQEQFPHPGAAIESEIEAIKLEFLREDFPELLESMKLGVERIRHISKSLRTFSRKDEEHKTAFHIHEGIDSTLLILKHRTKANEHRPKIQIVKDYGEIPELQCFPGQLNQVFMNILANAIDAFNEANQGKTYSEIKQNPNQIKISTSQLDETRVQIQIKDNGCGMTPETKARIFEPGFTTKEVGKGTGLGMAIAHQIITEKHGGTINCISKLGQGTTFTMTLPIA